MFLIFINKKMHNIGDRAYILRFDIIKYKRVLFTQCNLSSG